MKLSSIFLLKWSRNASYLLLITLPFGTRWIIAQGYIAGVPVEWGTISIAATQLLALAIWVLAAIHAFRNGGRIALLRPSGVPALLLILLAAAATTWSRDHVTAAIVTCWLILAVHLALSFRVTRPDPLIACIALAVGGTFQAILGLLQFFTQHVDASTLFGIASHAPADLGAFVVETGAGRLLRAYGTLPHPNLLGAVLVAAILAAIGAMERCHGRARMALAASLPILAAGLFFTFSRSAWLGLAVASAVFLFGQRRRIAAAPHTRRVILFSFAAVLVTGMILAGLYRDAVVTRMSASGRLEQRSVQERGSQMGEAYLVFLAHPLLGIGPGQMPITLADRDTIGREGWDYQPVHNVPALITVELGVIGFLAWCAVVVGAFAASRFRDDERNGYRLAFRSALAALLVMGLFDHYLWSLWIGQSLFWCVIGMLWSLREE
jgi:hypothetical protein